MKKFSAGRVAVLGLLLAMASIIFMIESLIPPLLPVAPYVKIGLANCVVLFVIIYIGNFSGFIFVIAKNLLTALFVQWFVLPFNLAGSLCSFFVMAGLYSAFFPKVRLVSISVAGAVCSNIARTCVAVLVTQAPSLYVQLPFVCAFSVAAGIVIGVLTTLSIKSLPERLTNFK